MNILKNKVRRKPSAFFWGWIIGFFMGAVYVNVIHELNEVEPLEESMKNLPPLSAADSIAIVEKATKDAEAAFAAETVNRQW